LAVTRRHENTGTVRGRRPVTNRSMRWETLNRASANITRRRATVHALRRQSPEVVVECDAIDDAAAARMGCAPSEAWDNIRQPE
jgi:hypothetical protein